MAVAGAPAAVVQLAERAGTDERRHATHCQTYVTLHGGPVLAGTQPLLVEYAPAYLSGPQQLLYEVVAQACIAETQSMTTLVTLLDAVESPDLRAVLHELARDEVNHSRLGWAFLAWAAQEQDVSFLGPLLPAMLDANSGPELFRAGKPEEEDTDLFQHGVVPHRMRRDLYIETLESVMLPGFEQHPIETAAAHAWLATKRQLPIHLI